PRWRRLPRWRSRPRRRRRCRRHPPDDGRPGTRLLPHPLVGEAPLRRHQSPAARDQGRGPRREHGCAPGPQGRAASVARHGQVRRRRRHPRTAHVQRAQHGAGRRGPCRDPRGRRWLLPRPDPAQRRAAGPRSQRSRLLQVPHRLAEPRLLLRRCVMGGITRTVTIGTAISGVIAAAIWQLNDLVTPMMVVWTLAYLGGRVLALLLSWAITNAWKYDR